MSVNKWQRLILMIGAAVCLGYSLAVWADGSGWTPDVPFVGGIALAALALNPKSSVDELLPGLRYVSEHKKVTIGASLLILLVTAAQLLSFGTTDAPIGNAIDPSTTRAIAKGELPRHADQPTELDPFEYAQRFNRRDQSTQPTSDPVAAEIERMRQQEIRASDGAD